MSSAPQADEFGHPQPRLDRHQQQGPVPAADPGRPVRRRQQRVDLLRREVFDQPPLVALAGDGQDAAALVGVGRLLERDVLEEGMDRRQACVAAPGAVAAFLLEVIEEVADEGRVQILEGQLRRGLPQSLFGEPQEQAEGVPVSGDGVRAGPALPQETVGEERLDQTGEVGARVSWLDLLRAFQPACRQFQQLRDGLDVPVRLVHMHVSRGRWPASASPVSTSMPARYHPRRVQTAKRCRMSCSLRAAAVAAARRRRPQADLTRDLGEVVSGRATRHAVAAFGEEEGRSRRVGGRPDPSRGHNRRVTWRVESWTATSRDLPNFVRRTRRIPSCRSTSSRSSASASLMRMPVTASNPKIVANVRPFSPAAEGSRPAAPTSSFDLRVAVDVRPLAAISAGQQAGGRHLRVPIRGAEPEGETPHHAQAQGPGRWLDTRGLLGPAECQVGGDMGSPLPFGEGHEASEQARPVRRLVTQLTAELEVLLGGLAQLAHRTASFVGHGRASERSPSDIDLRVDRRGLRRAVAEDLADLVQGRPGPEHPGRQGVPQDVRPLEVGSAARLG